MSEGNGRGTTQLGVLLVQLLDSTRIRVEMATGPGATLSAFTPAALVFTR